MSVDFYVCQNCGDTFPDCSDYFTCTSCDSMFCSYKCGGRKIDEDNCVDDNDLTTCVLCRMEIITDHDLVIYLLEKCQLTKEQACQEYRNTLDREL